MKIKPCLYYLGLSCFPISLMALVNIFYSFYFDYLVNINSYFIVLVLSIIVGLIFFRIGKIYKDSITIYEQLLLIFLVYFFISIFISIPYYISNYQISFINSYFIDYSMKCSRSHHIQFISYTYFYSFTSFYLRL